MIASIITALFLLGWLSVTTASNFLFICGVLLLAGEIALGTFWLVGFNGVLAILVGFAIRTGDTSLLGVPLGWGVLFGIAFIEVVLLIGSILVILKSRRQKITTGTESMIGQPAKIIEWNGDKGQVSIHGELWQAQSGQPLDITAGEQVTVIAVEGLVLKVKI
jgi:membrane-bound serine protease (ClpP class)